ncbi:MAG: enoyl-CoA hydratase [Spirochaetaceae bacterium]|nr:MAG: enoyl-CoA hydratase [Spirochaetaceae bacterium]
MNVENSPPVLHELENGTATLTLNRPEKRNALSLELMRAFLAELKVIRDSTATQVVVVRGAGTVFSSGHDLKELHSHRNKEYLKAVFSTCSEMMSAIVSLPQPVIAAVHGVASAAGCQLVASCDLAIATAEARFAVPGVNIGLFCSTPMVALSRAVSRKHAMEMLLTGELYSAVHAERIGLVNRVVAASELDREVHDLCAKITAKSRRTIATGKAAFYRQLEMGYDEAYDCTGQIMVENMLGPEAEEGIGAFLEKRPPVWP